MNAIRTPRIEYFQSLRHSVSKPDTQWFWRLVAPNGEKTADGSEGYATRRNVLRAIRKFQTLLAIDLPVIEVRG